MSLVIHTIHIFLSPLGTYSSNNDNNNTSNNTNNINYYFFSIKAKKAAFNSEISMPVFLFSSRIFERGISSTGYSAPASPLMTTEY